MDKNKNLTSGEGDSEYGWGAGDRLFHAWSRDLLEFNVDWLSRNWSKIPKLLFRLVLVLNAVVGRKICGLFSLSSSCLRLVKMWSASMLVL